MEKGYQERWEIIKKLGQGGQGIVYRVRDKSNFDLKKIARGLSAPSPSARESDQLPGLNVFKEAITDLLRMDDPNTHGALKVLLPPDKAKDPKRAEERLKREIEAMSKMSHPNLLKILDFDLEEKWFVSQFYAKGSLNLSKPFIGDFVGALNAFRPLVDGVAKLHEEGMVHRDIKPHNVFIDTEGKLILGDFGLVFSLFDEETRLSAIEENLGTRDYMPVWALNKRIEELTFSFDVFSLGKTLYAMIRGSVCPVWYYDRDGWELNKTISDSQHLSLANLLFSKCVRQEEEDCFVSAGEMLEVVDQILKAIDVGAALIKGKMNRQCKVCALGSYALVSDKGNTDKMRNFGLTPGPTEFKIFICKSCGHVQLFAFERGQDRGVWSE